MKKLEKILGVLSLVALILCVLPNFCVKAETVGFFEVYFDNRAKTCRINKYNGDEINVVIPDEIDGYKVVAIYGFNNKKYMQTVKLPKYLEKIGSSTFYDCVSLKEITIPGTVKEIVGFSDCTSLEKVTLNKGSEIIANSAFYGCSSLKSINLPNTITSIKQHSFEGTTSLEKIKLPEKLTEVENSAFNYSGIKEIDIPDSVTNTNILFYGCPNLKKVSFGKGLTKCQGVKYCPQLTTLDFSRATNCIEISNFNNNESLKYVKMPENLDIIGFEAFDNCTSLEKVELNEGLRIIEGQAFANCVNLKSLYIPKTVQAFDSSSFARSGITDIVYEGTIIDKKKMDSSIFDVDNKINFTVYDNSEFLSYFEDRADVLVYNIVKSVPSTSLKLNKSNVSIWEDETLNVKAILSPNNTTDSVAWESSNDSICYVSQTGRLTCKKSGSVIITARTVSGQIAQVSVVCQKLPTSLKVQDNNKKTITELTLKKGQKIQLAAYVDTGRTDVKVKWSTSKKSVATVSKTGRITAKKKGKCQIICQTAVGDLKTIINVVVK